MLSQLDLFRKNSGELIETAINEENAKWQSDTENDLIVADYFAMLSDETAGLNFGAARNLKASRRRLPSM